MRSKQILVLTILFFSWLTQLNGDIFRAVAKGDLTVVKEYIKTHPKKLNVMSKGGLPLLSLAINSGRAEVAELLIRAGADINLKTRTGLLPLHLSVMRGTKDIAELLLKRGADVNAEGSMKLTAVHLAVMTNRSSMLKTLIRCGADINRGAFRNLRAPLQDAIEDKKKDIASILIKAGADLSFSDKEGNSPLHYAVRAGEKNTVMQLLNKGADYNSLNAKKISPLLMMIKKGWSDMLGAVNFSAVIKSEDRDYRFRLSLALAANGFIEQLEKFIKVDMDINRTDPWGKTILHSSAEGNLSSMVSRLIKKGIPVDKRDHFNWTPLHYAVDSGSHEAVRTLLKRGADTAIRGRDGRTSLDIANDWGDKNAVALLEKAGALKSKDRELTINGSSAGRAALTYIANDGYMVEAGGRKFLVDPLNVNPFGYKNTPARVTDMIIKGIPPYDNIDFVIISHPHADHFNSGLLADFMLGNEKALLILNSWTEQVFKKEKGDLYEKFKDRVVVLDPEWGKYLRRSVKGMNLRFLSVNHSPSDGRKAAVLSFICETGGVKLSFIGDSYLKKESEWLKSLKLSEEKIDLLLISMGADSELIQSQRTVFMHLTDREIKKEFLSLKREDGIIFLNSCERKVFIKKGP